MAQDSGIFRPDFDFKTSLWLYRMGMHETLIMRGAAASLNIVRDIDSEFPSTSAKYAMAAVDEMVKANEIGIIDV